MNERFERPKVLELGAGNGKDLKAFEESGVRATGIDFSIGGRGKIRP